MNVNDTLLGPYDGQLDNGGEKLELERPEDLLQLGLGYVLVDRVIYDNTSPWPEATHGQGQSLHRISATDFGNFAASWSAAIPTPSSTSTLPENDPPISTDDSYNVNEGATLNIGAPGVLGNDTDANNDTLQATLQTGPNHGSLTFNSNGSFTYVHNGSETTSDGFTYLVSDGKGGTDVGTVQLNIAPQNDAPQATGDSYSVNEGAFLQIVAPGILANDTDVDSGSLTVSVVSEPDYGILTLNPNGSFTYQHDGNEANQDSFTYQVSDGQATDTATVSLSINPVNDPPETQPDSYAVDEGDPLSVSAPGVLANDNDADEDSLTVSLKSGPSHGSVSLAANGAFVYTHNGSETTSDSFEYEASDGNGGITTGSVSLTINPVNDPPETQPDSYAVDEGEPLNVSAPGVLANDNDADEDSLTVSLKSGPSHGSVSLAANGAFVYTHNGSETTSDSFEYEASDGNGGITTGRVDLTINPKNDAPVANNDFYGVSGGGTLNIDAPGVLVNDTDPESNTLVVSSASDPSHGTLVVNTNGSFVYNNDGLGANGRLVYLRCFRRERRNRHGDGQHHHIRSRYSR